MAQKTSSLLPTSEQLLRQLGERLRLARLRRRLSAKQLAERAGMSPMTLRGLERGGSGVTMGAYLAVMQVLGVEKDLHLLAQADPVGRELQDAQLPARTPTSRPPASSPSEKRPIKAKLNKSPVRPEPVVGLLKSLHFDKLSANGFKNKLSANGPIRHGLKPSQDAQDWIKKGGFADSAALADLLDPLPSPKKVS